jgi:zinc protease
VAGIEAITLDDVKGFIASAYTRAALTVGVAGDAPGGVGRGLKKQIAKLPAGPALAAPQGIAGKRPGGMEVEIIEKETRATAISFGNPIAVTRAHPDYAALYLARTWLGRAPLLGSRTSTSASARRAG